MNRMRFIYIIVCLLCTITLVQGVENKILFNRLDVNNGLSSNEVSIKTGKDLCGLVRVRD